MRSHAKCFDDLRSYIETIPLVDCHDHSIEMGPNYKDAMEVVVNGYFRADLFAVLGDKESGIIQDSSLSMDKRWPVLKKAWDRTCHTGYARVTKLVMQEFYGEKELTLAALKRMQKKLPNLEDKKTFEKILDQAGIAVRVLDVWPSIRKVMDGTLKLTPRGRLAISLPEFHGIRSWQNVTDMTAPLGRTVTSLDEYLDACLYYFKGAKKYGAICFKDQSAYTRPLDYGNPSRAEAEKIFNWFMEDPRRSASYPDGIKPLDDFLFHEFMRMAGKLDLPVQIHTGHMAGYRNRIGKTNAELLTPVLELHRDVRFDLFHANWPYSGELIFLAKNYPNVTIDFCWTNIIDPIYCQNMFKQVLSAAPHGKVHGYGTDLRGNNLERAWAHAQIARDNIAIALSEMVEMEYLGLDEAKQVAYQWLFSNANEFFKLKIKLKKNQKSEARSTKQIRKSKS